MFGIRMGGKKNWPLIIGVGAAGLIVYLFIAGRIVKPSVAPPMPPGGGGMPHPAAAISAAAGAGGGIPSGPAGGITGFPGRGAGYYGYPSGGQIQGGYATRAFDAFPYAARIAIS